MIIWGEAAGFAHEANGMTKGDIPGTVNVAKDLDEIVIFRSSGPWCKRWIDWGHPTKNFHVKGKSSDWGPHAGLVPYNGIYSKVGADAAKAAKGTAANDDGIASGFSNKAQLRMSRLQIHTQATKPEGGKTAIEQLIDVPGSRDVVLVARRSGAGATKVYFRGIFSPVTNDYTILVWPFTEMQNLFLVADAGNIGRLRPFEVMTSAEVGANNLPLTGDYDLMAVCPTWGQYGSKSSRSIGKAGIHLENGTLNKGLSFESGVGMDNVLDPRFHTMGKATANAALPLVKRGEAVKYKDGKAVNRLPNMSDFHDRQKVYQQGSGFSSDSLNLIFDQSKDREHGDMGNLTPRILRCINALNLAMGATGAKSALRRVHHNAESHRNRKWAGITEVDMVTKKDGDKFGDGFPLTAYHPLRITGGGGYFESTVCTIESLAEFKVYAQKVKEAGFYMPKNWIWNVA